MKFTFPPESKPLDGYTIKRAIHRGGFGEVYYALSDAGKEVALKLLQQNLEIELRGVTQCMNLKHPNLVTIFDVRQDGDNDHWIVMEYVRGKSLDKVIDEFNGPMPIEEVERWLAGMVAGLSFLHDRGIVHRDLKPANVFQENKVVKIGDVGLAKFITQSKRSAQTESVGTVYYMAPEVAHGRYGHEVDLYSLGIVLYEMLTGRVPFDGESTAEILMKHLSDKPDLTPLPKRLRPVLAEVLEKDPLKRTPTAEQLLADFRKAVAGVEIPTRIPDESFTDPVVASVEAANQAADAANRAANAATFVGESAAFAWTEAGDKKWDKHKAKLDRKADRHKRIEERKAARHERRMERHAERHARKQERKANKHKRKQGDETPLQVVEPVATLGAVPVPVHKAKPKDKAKEDQWSQGLKVGAIVLIVLAVVMPRTFVGLVGTVVKLGILGAIGYGIYWLVKSLSGNAVLAPATVQPKPQPDIGGATPFDRSFDIHKKKRARRHRHVILDPKTPREISLRSRVSELTGSLGYAVLCTALITAAVAFLSPVLQTPARVALFAGGSLLASWAVMLTAKWYEGTTVKSGQRRFITTLAGAAVGVAVFALHQFLLVNFTPTDFNQHSSGMVRSIGNIPLTDSLQPSLLGYVVFFAALFIARHWWRHADSLRRKRVAIGSILLTTLTGGLICMIFTFPLLWGVTWAAAISCIVHLAAAWMPHDQRSELRTEQV